MFLGNTGLAEIVSTDAMHRALRELPHPAFVQQPCRLQLSGRLVDPFCQPLPNAQESFVTDCADAADKQLAVEDSEARETKEAGGFQAGVGEVGTAGVMISSSPSSAC